MKFTDLKEVELVAMVFSMEKKDRLKTAGYVSCMKKYCDIHNIYYIIYYIGKGYGRLSDIDTKGRVVVTTPEFDREISFAKDIVTLEWETLWETMFPEEEKSIMLDLLGDPDGVDAEEFIAGYTVAPPCEASDNYEYYMSHNGIKETILEGAAIIKYRERVLCDLNHKFIKKGHKMSLDAVKRTLYLS